MNSAEIHTTHGSPAVATRIAAALAPDNTEEMDTRVEGDTVVTTIDRDSVGGLQATVDDYVVNLRVAAQLSDQPTTDTNHE